MRLLNGVAGLSDYVGKKQLMNALNMLTSFATYVLEKNSDPAMEVPEGTLNADSEVYREDFRVFQTNAQTKGIPRYITWDGGLTSLFEQRTHVIEMLALYSEISLGLLGKETGGPMPEAYRTARLKYMRTLMKMARKQRYWTEGLLWVMETSQKLTGVKDSSVSDFNIQFSDGLPYSRVDEFLSGEYSVAQYYWHDPLTGENEMSHDRLFVGQVPGVLELQREMGIKLTEYKS